MSTAGFSTIDFPFFFFFSFRLYIYTLTHAQVRIRNEIRFFDLITLLELFLNGATRENIHGRYIIRTLFSRVRIHTRAFPYRHNHPSLSLSISRERSEARVYVFTLAFRIDRKDRTEGGWGWFRAVPRHKRGVPPPPARASGGSLEILVRFTYFSVKGNTKGGSAVFGGRGELAVGGGGGGGEGGGIQPSSLECGWLRGC